MHTATRLAAPVIADVAARSTRRRGSARTGCTRRSTPSGCGRSAWTSARRRVRGGADRDRARRRCTQRAPATASGREAAAACRRALPRIHFLVPDRTRPAAARRGTRRCRCPTARGASSAPPRPAAAAGICAAIVRSSRSTKGSSASCSRTSCSPTSTRRSRPAPQHITFGDPDFFNGPTHAMRDRRGAARRASRRDLRRDDQGRASAAASRSAAAAAPRPAALFVTSAVESIDDARAGAARQGAHARRFRRGRRRCAATAGVTLVPTFVAFHPWLTLEGYCDLLDTIDALDLVDHVRADSAGDPAADPARLAAARARRDARAVGALRPGDADAIAGRIPIRASTSCSARSRRSSASRLDVDRRAVFDEIRALAHDRAGLPARQRSRPRAAAARRAVPGRALVLLRGAESGAGELWCRSDAADR